MSVLFSHGVTAVASVGTLALLVVLSGAWDQDAAVSPKGVMSERLHARLLPPSCSLKISLSPISDSVPRCTLLSAKRLSGGVVLVQGMRERLHPLSSLYLRPEDLPHYATQQFKFSFVRQLRAPENAKGFDRPMYLFQKIG